MSGELSSRVSVARAQAAGHGRVRGGWRSGARLRASREAGGASGGGARHMRTEKKLLSAVFAAKRERAIFLELV
jgi:hypothetical protein